MIHCRYTWLSKFPVLFSDLKQLKHMVLPDMCQTLITTHKRLNHCIFNWRQFVCFSNWDCLLNINVKLSHVCFVFIYRIMMFVSADIIQRGITVIDVNLCIILSRGEWLLISIQLTVYVGYHCIFLYLCRTIIQDLYEEECHYFVIYISDVIVSNLYFNCFVC